MKASQLVRYIFLLPIVFLIGCDKKDIAVFGLLIMTMNITQLLILSTIIGTIGLLIAITIYSLTRKNISYQLKILFGIILIIAGIINYVIPYRFSEQYGSLELKYALDKGVIIQYYLGLLYQSTIGFLIIIILSCLFSISGIVGIITAFKGQTLIEVPDFFKDLWGFLKVRKKYWMLPIILTLLFFGALMIFASGSAIAPFIYTIF